LAMQKGGAEWRIFVLDDEDTRYYDAESITLPSDNIVSVWVKPEYNDKGIIKMVEKFAKKYENISRTMSLVEINCSDKRRRTIALHDYSTEGTIIFSSAREYEWTPIVPGSVAGALFKAVCK